ncbi:asparaginase [Paenibacillus tarimensis]
MGERLIEEYRGGSLENIHFGHICGVDESGSVVYRTGDPEWVTFMRSAAKPFQAVPAFAHRVDERYGLSDREKTIMMASHRAEPEHVEALESMKRKIGVDEEDLACGSTYPLSGQARDALLLANKPKRKLYHNCSGKHLGVMALCKGMGYPIQGYDGPGHPAQQEILKTVAYLTGCPEEQVRVGIDGCGFPVFGLSLRHMAVGYMKLACPDLIDREDVRQAAVTITRLMNEYPDMISAPWFICSQFLRDPNIVAKGGAKGVYCFGLKKERLAFALKVLDGSEEEWPLIIASILEQIGYDNRETIDRLYRLTPTEIKNDGQTIVGENKAVFKLKKV